MGLVRITERNVERFRQQIVGLESSAEYPLGDDFFKINHGADYFKFFNRLGEVRYYVWNEGERVAAVAAAVLRSVPLKQNKSIGAWYMSDLKVHPDFRGQNIPVRMLGRAFLPSYLRCQRGYAISMNSPGVTQNKVVRLLGHFRWAPMSEVARLAIWSLDADQMLQVQPVLEKHRGPVRYLSLSGIKDIVLRSTDQPMPLLHAQFGPLADMASSDSIASGAVHMFCSPEGDLLSRDVIARGFNPSSVASVIAHRMGSCDWSWVLTSDI